MRRVKQRSLNGSNDEHARDMHGGCGKQVKQVGEEGKKNTVAANSRLFKWGIPAVDMGGGKYLYSIIVLFIARYAGLGSGRPEVKPSTPRPLPLWVSRVDEMGTSPHRMPLR